MELSDFVSETLIRAIVWALKFAAVYLAFVWLALAFWTLRDIRRRTHDPVFQTLAVALTLFFFVPGYWLYLILRPAMTLGEVEEERFRERVLSSYATNCPSCRETVLEDFIVCPTCRYTLKQACTACSHALQPKWKSCPYCGLALVPMPRTPVSLADRQLPEGSAPVIA